MIATRKTAGDGAASDELQFDAAPLLRPVAAALSIWDRLGAEIGHAAVVTPGPWAPFLMTVATWYGATPLLVGAAGADAGAESATDAAAVSELTRVLAEYPAVCAIELTGRADMVDLLLDSVPKYSHVLFAGRQADRFTIDYYVNVHRKGLTLASTVFPPSNGFAEPADHSLMQRAARLLMNASRAAACQRAMATVSQTR